MAISRWWIKASWQSGCNLTPWPTHKVAACRCSAFLITSSMLWIFSMFDSLPAFLYRQQTAKHRSFERTHYLYCLSHHHQLNLTVNNKFSSSASFTCPPISQPSALQMCTTWSLSRRHHYFAVRKPSSVVTTLWFVPFRCFRLDKTLQMVKPVFLELTVSRWMPLGRHMLNNR